METNIHYRLPLPREDPPLLEDPVLLEAPPLRDEDPEDLEDDVPRDGVEWDGRIVEPEFLERDGVGRVVLLLFLVRVLVGLFVVDGLGRVLEGCVVLPLFLGRV